MVEIVRRLTGAGFETWCVGGAVRDALLGIRNQDWDIATAAEPGAVQRLFRRTTPHGIKFGTIGVVDRHGAMHEVTTFRRDVTHDGRHAVVEFGASLVEDLQRRDFTVNAIAYQPLEARLYDPFDGRRDLEAGIVRAVGVPAERFIEDRLRVLRGIRFAARFEFDIEPATWEAMVESGPHLGRLSPERVKQELDKTLDQATRPSGALVRWRECGAFASLIPQLAHVSLAVLLAVDATPRALPGMTEPRKLLRRQLRIATLFSARPVSDVATALKALRAPNQESAFVSSLVEKWQQLGPQLTRSLLPPSAVDDAQLRKWAAAIGRTRVRPVMRVAAARWTGMCRAAAGNDEVAVPRTADVRAFHRRIVTAARKDAIEVADLAVDGDDLRTAGIVPGPQYGQILGRLLDAVVSDPSANTRAELLELALGHYAALRDRDASSPGRSAS